MSNEEDQTTNLTTPTGYVTEILPDDVLLDKRQTSSMAKISAPTMYRGIKDGWFPPPIKLGSRSYWIEREIITWLNNSLKKRNARFN